MAQMVRDVRKYKKCFGPYYVQLGLTDKDHALKGFEVWTVKKTSFSFPWLLDFVCYWMQGDGGVFHIGADMGNSTDMANFEIHGDLTLYQRKMSVTKKF